MNICDICKSENVMYNTAAVVNNKGHIQKLELCSRCYHELRHREESYKYQAYEETVKAMTGEIPRKFHWWNKFTW